MATLLALIAKFGPKIPQAIALIQAAIALFIDDTSLELTTEEQEAVTLISQKYTEATGEAAVFDFSRIKAFATKHPELTSILVGILKSAIGI